MPGMGWMAAVGPFHTADAAAVTASATLTELTPTPQVLLPYPMLADFAGKRIEYQAWGLYTTTATQGTITLDLRLGPTGAIGSMTSVAATPAITWVASQTNRFWHIEGHISIRTLGAAGTCVGFLDATSGFASGATDVAGLVAGTAAGSTAAVDTTQTRAIALGATISVASQSITCRYFGVRSVN